MLDVPDIGRRHSVLVREPERSGPVFFRDTECNIPDFSGMLIVVKMWISKKFHAVCVIN
jgi:hypothetical protein